MTRELTDEDHLVLAMIFRRAQERREQANDNSDGGPAATAVVDERDRLGATEAAP
jgi:hypothetical protein